jgi:hypothetical protein
MLPYRNHTARKGRLIASLTCIGTLGIVMAGALKGPSATATEAVHSKGGRISSRKANDLPLAFEANRNQAARDVLFLSRGRGYYVEFGRSAATLKLKTPQGRQANVKMSFADARPERIEGTERLPGVVNYYLGEDRSRWIRGVPTFERVHYKRVYDGVDAVFYGRQGKLEYDLEVAPGADPSQIRLSFEGTDSLNIEDGELVIQTAAGAIRQHRPEVYQMIGGSKRAVAGEYSLLARNEVAFRIGPYDRERALTIDPVLSYSTYAGGAGDDRGNGVAVDSAGNAYIVGQTDTGFPDTNAFVQKVNAPGTAILYTSYLGSNCNDDGRGIAVDGNGNAYVTGLLTLRDQWGFCNNKEAYVSKVDPTGAQVYATYFGGNDDHGNAIAVDAAGNAWVTGQTNGNFPVTNGSTGGFPGDAFILELDGAGKNILYATYIGGGSIDAGNAIAVDHNGKVYIAGWMQSCDFPVINGFQANCASGGVDGFLAVVNPTTNQYLYTTYIGGSDGDAAYALAVDKNGYVYVTGDTTSDNFFFTPGACDVTCGTDGMCNPTWDGHAFQNMSDGWVIKIDPAKSGIGSLMYSTYFGGSGVDRPHAIAVDSTGNAYIAGETMNGAGMGFPILNAFQPAFGGNYDGFIAVLNPTGTGLLWSSYLGGAAYDTILGIALDTSANVYVTGYTGSTNFPIKNAIQAANGGSYDAFLAKVGNGQTASALAGVTVNPASVTGGSPSTGTVTLTAPAPAAGATVTLASNNAAAVVPASVTVAAGATSGTFTVNTTAPTATVTATLTATYAGVSKTTALTVNPAATLSTMSMNPAAVVGGANSTGTVTLTSAAPTGGLAVTLSSSNTAAAVVPASVLVAAGATTATFTTMTASVTASTAVTITATCSGGSKTAALTVNAALASVSLNPATVVAGQTSTGTVTLGAPAPAGGAVVTLASSNTGAAKVPASVTVAAGATTGSFAVTAGPVAANTTATISASYSGAAKTAVLSVNALLTGLTLNPASLIGGSASTGTIMLAAPAPAGGIVVVLSSNSTAASVGASVTVAAGATSAAFNVATSAVTANTTATITATAAGASKTAALTVKPWVASLAMNPTTIPGGMTSTGSVVLNGPAPAGGAMVTLSSSNTAAATVPASITIAAGATTGSFTASTTAVTANTAVTFSASYGGSTKTAVATVMPLLSSVTLNPNSVTGVAAVTGTITLTAPAPAGGSVVTLASSNSAATVPASVAVPAGVKTATFTVNTQTVAANTAVTITASLNGATRTAALTVKAWLGTLTVNPAAVVGGGTATATVTLTAPAAAGGAVVTLTSNNAAATVPPSVAIAAGATTASFSANTGVVTANVAVTITVSYGGSSKTALLTVMPLLKSLTLNATSVTGPGGSTGTVTLNAAAPAGGSVVALSSNNAAAGSVPASVTVAAGATSATFAVTTSNVAANVTVTVSATLAGATKTAVLTVKGWVASVTLNPASVTGGATSTGTITLSAPAPSGGAAVALVSANTGAAALPASILVPAGSTTGTFTVTSKIVAASTNVAISATYGGSTKSATLTVN